jgi:ubiquitin thioesterase OTU1
MRIRLRGPSGASTINLEENATVRDLCSLITEKTALTSFDIKYGYPPKPLHLGEDTTLLSSLDVPLAGEQLIISAQDGTPGEGGAGQKPAGSGDSTTPAVTTAIDKHGSGPKTSSTVSFAGMPGTMASKATEDPMFESSGPIPLKRKGKDMEVPELPLPDRGATMGMKSLNDV